MEVGFGKIIPVKLSDTKKESKFDKDDDDEGNLPNKGLIFSWKRKKVRNPRKMVFEFLNTLRYR